MATGVTVEHRRTPGVDHLDAILSGTAREVSKDVAELLRDHARSLAPVRTGYLKSSIQIHGLGGTSYRVSVGAHYGKFVEYGTRYMHAQPFFTPAVELARREAKVIWRERYAKNVRKRSA